MRVWQITSLMLFMLLGWAPLPADAQQAPLAGLDEFVNKAMKDWDVPGLAIAVIKDDRIVLARGYGVRELGKPEPVDERTVRYRFVVQGVHRCRDRDVRRREEAQVGRPDDPVSPGLSAL